MQSSRNGPLDSIIGEPFRDRLSCCWFLKKDPNAVDHRIWHRLCLLLLIPALYDIRTRELKLRKIFIFIYSLRLSPLETWQLYRTGSLRAPWRHERAVDVRTAIKLTRTIHLLCKCCLFIVPENVLSADRRQAVWRWHSSGNGRTMRHFKVRCC